jgi:hypothetical protein
MDCCWSPFELLLRSSPFNQSLDILRYNSCLPNARSCCLLCTSIRDITHGKEIRIFFIKKLHCWSDANESVVRINEGTRGGRVQVTDKAVIWRLACCQDDELCGYFRTVCEVDFEHASVVRESTCWYNDTSTGDKSSLSSWKLEFGYSPKLSRLTEFLARQNAS